ncbi:MAG: helix-turn-helix domain-containing protein [Chloroflexi bacterium]|nr:helix-turn-helix domain-containing protein [Chloroflexota bacterium]
MAETFGTWNLHERDAGKKHRRPTLPAAKALSGGRHPTGHHGDPVRSPRERPGETVPTPDARRRLAVIVSRIRAKLGDQADVIDTVTRVGYRLAPSLAA